MTPHARGVFEVKIVPQAPDEKFGDPTIGRMALDKLYRGDLEATSRGEMLAAMTAVKDSAGYVALERVDGTLAGRKGTFALQHSGTMDRGRPSLKVGVVPDSGTGQLEGIAGSMTITIEGGRHFYELDYTLPAEGR